MGLVKRSMDIRVGRLELWPDPPVLGRISHLIRFAFARFVCDLRRGIREREGGRERCSMAVRGRGRIRVHTRADRLVGAFFCLFFGNT